MLIFLLLLLIGIPVALLRGVVLSDMWGWFITPLGAPPIGVINAIGISFIVTFFLSHLATKNDKTPADKWYQPLINSLISGILTSLLFWLFAYIWHLFL